MEELYYTLFYPPQLHRVLNTEMGGWQCSGGSARKRPATEGCITYACAGNRNGMETRFFGDIYAVPRMYAAIT